MKKLRVLSALCYTFSSQAAYVVMKDGQICHKAEDKAAVTKIYDEIITPLSTHVLPATLALEGNAFDTTRLVDLLDNPSPERVSVYADFMNSELQRFPDYTAYSVKYVPTADYEMLALCAFIDVLHPVFNECGKDAEHFAGSTFSNRSSGKAFDAALKKGMRYITKDQRMKQRLYKAIKRDNTSAAFLKQNNWLGLLH